jgi:hypothetical protein
LVPYLQIATTEMNRNTLFEHKEFCDHLWGDYGRCKKVPKIY